jgi:hypothetical protein
MMEYPLEFDILKVGPQTGGPQPPSFGDCGIGAKVFFRKQF